MRLSPSRSTRDSGISAEVALSRVRRKFSTNKVRITRAFALLLMALAASIAAAQQPNPVVRKVDNPVTDTPYVNPLQQDQPVRTPASKLPPIQAGDRLDLACGNQTSRKEPNGDLITVCEGNVDARIGTYRLQADKVTVNNGKNLVVADGNVVFDQGEQQRNADPSERVVAQVRLGRSGDERCDVTAQAVQIPRSTGQHPAPTRVRKRWTRIR